MQKTINVSLNEDAVSTTFVVEDWPTSLKEAADMWGEYRCFAVLEEQAVVKAQGKWRNLQKRKVDPLTSAKATQEMRDWSPSEGKKRLSPSERAKRTIEKSGLSREELLSLLSAMK